MSKDTNELHIEKLKNIMNMQVLKEYHALKLFLKNLSESELQTAKLTWKALA